MAKTALITGVSGQDGSYLAELLLTRGYTVVGLQRKGSDRTILPFKEDIVWEVGSIRDREFVQNVLARHAPDEVYNLAGVTNVINPWEQASDVVEVTGVAPLVWLEEIMKVSVHTRFIQAASSEIYDKAGGGVRDEESAMLPSSPYGMSKLLVLKSIRQMRQQGLWGSNAILFNHESPRRGPQFLTRKVTKAFARMRKDSNFVLEVGSLEARRDWGHAKDYVQAMHTIASADAPDDFVVATGVLHSVRDVIVTVAQMTGIRIEWDVEQGVEVGKDSNGHVRVRTKPALVRSDEAICGDASKIRQRLGWEPTISFEKMLEEMVTSELANGY
jgi:GDPmannose 4,6-dehydratase